METYKRIRSRYRMENKSNEISCRTHKFLIAIGLMAFTLSNLALCQDKISQYTFAWPFEDQTKMVPRGGTTTGPSVTLAPRNIPTHTSKNLAKFERDRIAILSMQGGYRATFDFIETVGLTKNYEAKAPYQSWGTEFIYLVEDRGDFISLQHILVMRIIMEDGSVSEPFVMKHWRQDWQYEDTDLHQYKGHNVWSRKVVDKELSRGKWSQAVFQVDDSPRYEALGEWSHPGKISIWTSHQTRRPLPRREFSVRSDYHLLEGVNRLTINFNGWVQEEDNLKKVLGRDEKVENEMPYLAREAGIARYELIKNYDFSAGDEYWKKTSQFWSLVRSYWRQILGSTEKFKILASYEDRKLYQNMFQLADEAANGLHSTEKLKRLIETELTRFVQAIDTK